MPILTAPTHLVSLETVKQHLRIDHDFDDDLLGRYIASAFDRVQTYTGRKFKPVRNTEYHEFAPKVELWYPDVESIESVSYFSEDGNWEYLDPSDFKLVETRHPEIFIPDDYPVDCDVEFNVRVVYTACSDITEDIRHALLLLIGTLYEVREDTIVGAEAMKVPVNIEYLLSPYRYHRFS